MIEEDDFLEIDERSLRFHDCEIGECAAEIRFDESVVQLDGACCVTYGQLREFERGTMDELASAMASPYSSSLSRTAAPIHSMRRQSPPSAERESQLTITPNDRIERILVQRSGVEIQRWSVFRFYCRSVSE